MIGRYRIAFQLYTSRNFPPLEDQLAALAEMGYDAVEPFLPNYGDDPEGFRRSIDAAGLGCTGFHLPFDGLVADPGHWIDVAHTIGAGLLIPPWLAPEARPTTAEGWREVGHKLRDVEVQVREAGLRLAWHNHDFEYQLLADGSRPIDHLLDAAGPGVGYEADFAWVIRGGGDPAAEVERHGDRMLAVQLKDTMPAGTTAEGGWAATGDGVVDWLALWPLLAGTPADHLVVEHDEPDDWQRIARRSIDYVWRLAKEAA